MLDNFKDEAIEICKKILTSLHKNNFKKIAALVDKCDIED